MAASLTWFAGLGFGAARLAGLFARPVAWRVLDGVVATVMLGLAAGLALT
ncbi:Transporter, LysE family [Pseudonocardia sp. Ae168_Ps1]|nr:Transporter, LysE family [Pseudonocardia sp. Ae150A_Ps1]OLL78609.1 Transporter, LysE family [Pseudonocardia sp. Ae168_Ps1]OLL87263.1 Transporter, LysE family [Pseudonocardia sp. Ae263_Ps1]OLL92706.1 Transporter, LysE family [Pseudonocardia sp. Ae356_Ps1]